MEWLASKFGNESVIIGGKDYTDTDPVARIIMDKIRDERIISRSGLNIALKAGIELGLITISEDFSRDASKDFEEADSFAEVVLREKLGNEQFARRIVRDVMKAFFELDREGTYWGHPDKPNA